jgi:NhaP-type Na+/H+ or K+/H+ antiporter
MLFATGLKGVIPFALATRALRELPSGDLMITFTIFFSITGVKKT